MPRAHRLSARPRALILWYEIGPRVAGQKGLGRGRVLAGEGRTRGQCDGLVLQHVLVG